MGLSATADDYTAVPFQIAGSISLPCTTVSATAVLSGGGDQVVVTNWGSVVAFVQFSGPPTAATTASQAVLPGTQILMTRPKVPGSDSYTGTVSGITSTGTTTLQISTGWGF